MKRHKERFATQSSVAGVMQTRRKRVRHGISGDAVDFFERHHVRQTIVGNQPIDRRLFCRRSNRAENKWRPKRERRQTTPQSNLPGRISRGVRTREKPEERERSNLVAGTRGGRSQLVEPRFNFREFGKFRFEWLRPNRRTMP